VARYGVVDIGSNGIRMILAAIQDGQLEILEARREPVRLGADVYRDGRISAVVIDKVVTAIRGFVDDCAAASVDATKAIATAATREAANRDHLVARIKEATGIDVEVISGDREAELLCLAVQKRMDLGQGRSLLLDLGGGSIELATVEGDHVHGASFPLGALRLLREIREIPENEDLVVSLYRRIEARRAELETIVRPPFDRFVVVGGSIETLGGLAAKDGEALDEEGVMVVSLETVRRWQEQLAQLLAKERQARYQLPPERVDTIVPAAAVTTFVGELAQVERVAIPRVDLRHGLLWELAGATLSTGDDDH
jgi:exopolyphosphatase/guanosine-5'-triphosphate,3'-diphosphate pyrophosphatase